MIWIVEDENGLTLAEGQTELQALIEFSCLSGKLIGGVEFLNWASRLKSTGIIRVRQVEG